MKAAWKKASLFLIIFLKKIFFFKEKDHNGKDQKKKLNFLEFEA